MKTLGLGAFLVFLCYWIVDVEKLTKEKELELLRFAYESHKELMTNSMKILEKGF